MKKIFTLVLAICAVSVVLGGCSGGEEAKTGDTAGTPAPEKKEGE